MTRDWAAFGYPPSALVPIGIVEIACAIVYAFPPTSVLGAVLAALAWLGLYLREPRLRALLPLRIRRRESSRRQADR